MYDISFAAKLTIFEKSTEEIAAELALKEDTNGYFWNEELCKILDS